ncbi:MAG TPA: NmrA family NAD(P)-binding protein [Cyclobacteriaceae bacterium]|nr:NmrA family NAD(P)-binding protein [Cyclobacteriaceae bacterium]
MKTSNAMKYVITGSIGNISLPVTNALLNEGHDITVITSKQEKAKAIESLGAKAAVGSVEDVNFLTKTFAGANAVYTMIPPNFAATEWKKWIACIGKNYADAIKATGVKYVVNLSSVGAHKENGTGPVSGLHRVEEALNALTNVNIKHLRPAYFYQNLFSCIDLIKHAGIIGSNFSVTNNKFGIVDPADIATVVIESLLQLDFTGTSVRYVASDDVSTSTIANEIGAAIGKSDLAWVSFTNEQAYDGMKKAGLPEEITRNYVEMGDAINRGIMYENYWKHHPATLGKTKLKDFATVFAAAYNGN